MASFSGMTSQPKKKVKVNLLLPDKLKVMEASKKPDFLSKWHQQHSMVSPRGNIIILKKRCCFLSYRNHALQRKNCFFMEPFSVMLRFLANFQFGKLR